MLQFFYKTRNILGLILVVSPALALLPMESSFSMSLPFLFGLAAGMPLLCAAFRIFPLKIWTLLCAVMTSGGFLLSAASQSAASPQSAISAISAVSAVSAVSSGAPASFQTSAGALLSGLGACGLLLILPPNLIVGWFRKSKTTMLGLVWSCALLLTQLWRMTAAAFPPSVAAAIALVPILTGGLVFLEKPPVDYARRNPLISRQRNTLFKSAAYVSILSASLGLIYSLTTEAPAPAPAPSVSLAIPAASSLWPELPAAAVFLALVLAPLLVSLLIEKKGIFSGCILLIFMLEAATLCLGALSGYGPGWRLCGIGLLCMSIAALQVVVPVLTFYLYGQMNYLESMGKLAFFLPIGLLSAEPLRYMTQTGQFPRDEAVVFLLLLLVASFFCIFSAWKRRLVLLKNNAA